MSTESQRLQAVMLCMTDVQQATERLCRVLLELDPDGTRFPSMRATAETLAQISAGWFAAGNVTT